MIVSLYYVYICNYVYVCIYIYILAFLKKKYIYIIIIILLLLVVVVFIISKIGFSRMMIGYLVIAFFQVPTHTFPGCCNGLDSWDVGLRKQWRESMSALYVKMLGDKTHVMFHHPFFYPFPILCSILFAILFLSPSLSLFLSCSLYILFHILQHNPPFPDTPIYSWFYYLNANFAQGFSS